MVAAVAIRSAVRFSDRIIEHLAGRTDPVWASLEALAFTVDLVAEKTGIRLLFSVDPSR